MAQEIRFCTASDNTRLAYAKVGQGPPLVKVGNWMSHLEYDWNSPVWEPWLAGWSRFHAFYRYDQRGCGLSDRDIADFSFDTLVGDLEAVVDEAGLEKFDLFAMSQGGSVAVAYTARHPERVSRLIIYGGYIRGRYYRKLNPEQFQAADVKRKLLELSWGTENPAYRQVFTTFLIPEGTPEQFTWFNNLQLVSTSPGNAVKLAQTFDKMDVRESAKKIKAPTLVLQAKDDATVTFEIGRETATYIPGACFVILESKNHVLLSTEPAWPHFWSEFYHFLGIETESVAREKQTPDMIYDRILMELSTRERDVLRLLAEGYQNKEIAKKLILSEKTVRNYISNIYAKLQIKSRGEAIVLARKSGLVDDST